MPTTAKGNKYIVMLMDYFSRWPEAAGHPDKTAQGVGMFLYVLFCRFVGTIAIYLILNNRNAITLRKFIIIFTIQIWLLWDHDLGSGSGDCKSPGRRAFSSHRNWASNHISLHPQTNGLTERFNQTLQTALMKMVNEEQNDWDEHLPAVLFAYHMSQQWAIKMTPFEVMYCR